MAKSRMEKNKKLYKELDEEMQNNKEKNYEEKLKSIDPKLNDISDSKQGKENERLNKKNDNKSGGVLTVIAKEVNGQKTKKNEIVVVKDRKISKKSKKEEKEEESFNDLISFTDKLSVEEILRAKIEQQQRIRDDKKKLKKGPNDSKYTPEMMQERIKLHEGIDVRKEAKIQNYDYRWVAITLLAIALIAIIVIGALLIFKVIEV